MNPAPPEEARGPAASREPPGVLGYHPFSGRDLSGLKGAEGFGELEPVEPVFLKIHGEECVTEPLPGADVWLFRFEEREKILVPVLPSLPESPVGGPGAAGAARPLSGRGCGTSEPGSSGLPPAKVLDRLFDPGSPFRPSEGLYLGRTPFRPS